VRRWTVVAVVLVLIGGIVGFFVVRGRDSGNADAGVTAPTKEVAAYLAAWDKQDYATMASMVFQAPSTYVAQHEAMARALEVTNASYVAGPVTLGVDRVSATAPYSATLQLRGLGPWRYSGTLTLIRSTTDSLGVQSPVVNGQGGGTWKVVWSPSTMQPQLSDGQTLVRTRMWAPRGPILDANGQPIVSSGTVIQVGVEPDRVKNAGQVKAALAQQLGIAPAAYDKAVAGAQPSWFVPLTTITESKYAAVKPVLYPIPGIQFPPKTGRVQLESDIGGSLVGSVQPITAEQLQQLGAPYEVGDSVGTTGIEGAYERRLAGTPSGAIEVVDATTHKVVRVLRRFAGIAPQPVQTTIDPGMQAAADAALANVSQPAALVAVDVNSGEVRAVSNGTNAGFDRALQGHYPPGSTFKIVTSTAVLGAGATATTPITCPPALTVEGETFHNFDGEATGTVTFRTAFAKSCNNAFVQLVQRAGVTGMERAAHAYGFGVNYQTGLPSFGGSYPTPRDDAELAQSSFGQARVLASPLQMASVAAAVAHGQWRAPVLVRGLKQPAAATTVPPIAPNVAATVRDFMTAVVQPGGTAAGVSPPGHPMAGKTGTAQLANTGATDAWFVGYSGPTAFAVVVEGGGVGGSVAAPIAAHFVQAL
jgi:cell division protein FtsI/penicillin-binding protein 2